MPLPIAPFSALISGEWKTGKTHACLTVFNSKYVEPERILYLDNHRSTRAFPHIHRYTEKEKWGIWEVNSADVERVDSRIEGIISAARTGKAPYDIIVVDDLTELELQTFLKEESKFDGKDRRQLWGKHLDNMCQRQRRLILGSGAAFLATCRVGAMDDFTKPGVRDVETKQLVRPQVIRPLIRGKIGEWSPYNFDALIWQRAERTRTATVGVWDFAPAGSIRLGHRWEYYPAWPKEVKEPNFDSLVDLIQAAETWGKDNLGR